MRFKSDNQVRIPVEFLPQFTNDSAEQEQPLRDCPLQRFNKPIPITTSLLSPGLLEPLLASVAVGHAMLHYMHNELVICQDNKISSFMLMLKVMKTQIEVTQLTLIARKLHRWSSQTRRLQRRMLLRVIDNATPSHLHVPALLVRTRR
ncbi:hypothetical protein T4A_12225 [Trichinella pseudospiralis]|uniref:Uncharacterized protein n=1 Tax=Trichinella pseudospiralis TaxID=6337 RepID=A0A0V1ER21_TRIPS|nr:hypothetical protein T4A_12225 [Trichinella pseudospiralis]